MNETEMSRYICDTFKGVDVVAASHDNFFFYNPDSNGPPDHKYPFVTIVTHDDDYDQFSNLNRASVFRLSIGIGKQTFQALFGLPERSANGENAAENDATPGNHDFTILDQLMPHPVYGRMYWVCVLNPGNETFETKVRPLLAEAYHMAVSKYDRQHPVDNG